MKLESTNLKQYGSVKVGGITEEYQGSRRRYVMCKGIWIENGIYYAHWQFVLAKTMKPYGKSTSFFKQIEPNTQVKQ